ncbi:IS1634 family transposase [Atopobium sp. oral taxon 416]|uniref:IS1634 family transposase n=1 Tax=Atopobium sp. oral taxon 416 TaxID=712157 RepID=UPI001BACA300|nr:IS1634 family transposase [Atopobium sp. oral taxon 416]QUC04314.1 IS1634 family transposase [Atopobium sp. oral taxon 416]
MFLKKTKRPNGRITLSAVQGYRDPKTGRPKQRSVETFGYVDELEKEFKDPLAHFAEVVKAMDEERLAAEGPQTITIHPLQKVDKRAANRKCVGDAVPMAYYDALGIEGSIRSNMRGRKVAFDVNSLLRLLVSERLLSLGSEHAAWQRADRHLLKADLGEADVYWGLGELSRMKGAIVSKMNASIAAAGIRDLSNGYYDCTNYFFESDGDDLRRRGAGKEHRPVPIVQMGLMQDGNGVPVDFNLFLGNTHDDATLIDALPEAKRAAGMGRVVTVADKGMNCACNIIATVARGDGFVFSQSIRGAKSRRELREWVLSDGGYDVRGDGEFKMKSRQDVKLVKVPREDSRDGKAHEVEVPVLVVAFWSRKYAERARHEREKVLQKSEQLVKSPGKYTKATHLGAAKYVRNVEFDADTGEVIDNPKKPELDLKAIDEDAACDGYYCIVTSETSWEPGHVIDTYRELWRIEESFKVTKSHLRARLVFVWTREHIQAHFLTCYIALTIERVIEHALGHRYSAGEILDDLRAQECVHAEGEWWLLSHRTDLTDELFSLIGEEAPRKWMTMSSLKALFRKGKEVRWKPA